MSKAYLSFVFLFTAIASKSFALTTWINWNGAPPSYPFSESTYGVSWATYATGFIVDPTTFQTINVTFSGEVSSWSEFNSSSPSALDWFGNTSTYLGPNVDNLPPQGNFIATTGVSGLTNTLTFSQPVTNLLMAIASMGGAGFEGSYQFNRVPSVISNGSSRYTTQTVPLQVRNGTEIFGQEGNGMVQFFGTFTSLTWTIPNPEAYSAFNLGITSVPEPSTFSLLATSLGGWALLRRRRSA